MNIHKIYHYSAYYRVFGIYYDRYFIIDPPLRIATKWNSFLHDLYNN